MRFDKRLLAGLLASGVLLSASAALAQPAGTVLQNEDGTVQEPIATATGEPLKERTPADNWLKVCDTLDSGDKACIMRQLVIQGGQFTGSFVLRDDPGQENRLLAVAAVPLGVLLPFGLSWQIDSGRPLRVPYMVCDPNSCVSQLVVNEAYVDSLKKGAMLTLTARNRQNKDIVIQINLGGFTSVWEGENALTVDEFQAQESGQAALEQLLADRAEQIRQERENAASGGDGTAGGGDGTTGGGEPPPSQ